ncbi:MAG: SsrA-binding protein SmpB [Dehalococcoidia bacterium]
MAEKVVTVNRKAYHDYQILRTLEAGLVLTGTEIKAIRLGRVNLRDAYVRPEGGEMWLVGSHVGPYPAAGRFNHEAGRRRKLLLHRDEMLELGRSVQQQGLTLVPLRLYLKDGLAKVELALARGRRKYDKREVIARREAERQMQRALRRRV